MRYCLFQVAEVSNHERYPRLSRRLQQCMQAIKPSFGQPRQVLCLLYLPGSRLTGRGAFHVSSCLSHMVNVQSSARTSLVPHMLGHSKSPHQHPFVQGLGELQAHELFLADHGHLHLILSHGDSRKTAALPPKRTIGCLTCSLTWLEKNKCAFHSSC